MIKLKVGELFFKEIEKNEEMGKNTLSKILLADQISRHLFRNDPDKYNLYSDYAIKHSEFILKNNKEEEYKPNERIFIMLPFRHTKKIELIEYSLKKVKEWEKEKSSSYYKRFIKASYILLGKVINEENQEPRINKSKLNLERILEFNPKEEESKSKEEESKFLIQEFLNRIKEIKEEEIIISISGGVDSMVLSHLLKTFTKKTIKGLHIDYNQRRESKEEAAFVIDWCNKKGIEIFTRRITEISKKEELREIYEEVTREIRFDMYKRVNKKAIVLLGHHKNDIIENIISNIKKGKNNNNLKGMENEKEIQGVKIVRPLLNITKSEIIRFAKENGIPYLKDSTKPTTERGKIRNEIIPVLSQDHINGLIRISEEYKEMYNTIIKNIAEPFIKEKITKIEKEEKIIYKMREFEEITNYIFWKYVINRIGERVSNKSLRLLIKRISKGRRVNLKKDFYFEKDSFIKIK